MKTLPAVGAIIKVSQKHSIAYNKTGRVVGYDSGADPLCAVEFFEPLKMAHTCNGLTKDNYGWFVRKENLRAITKPKKLSAKKLKEQSKAIIEEYNLLSEIANEGR
jgi:hypothetical protein